VCVSKCVISILRDLPPDIFSDISIAYPNECLTNILTDAQRMDGKNLGAEATEMSSFLIAFSILKAIWEEVPAMFILCL
jgi:hypothetical protein